MIGWIIRATLGPIARIFTGGFDYATRKAEIEGEIMGERIRADIELNHIKAQMRAIDMGWWGTRYIVPGFAYPLILWWGAVIIDSVFPHAFPKWNVARLPDPLMDWAGSIMMSFFIVRGAEIAVSAFRTGFLSSVITAARGVFTRKPGAGR